MRRIILLLLLHLLLSSCSRQGIMKMITKTPDISSYPAKKELPDNDYQKDLIYLQAVIKNAYPRLEEKIPLSDFDSLCQNYIQQAPSFSGQELDIVIWRIMAALQDVHSCYNARFYKMDEKRFYYYLSYENGYWYVFNIDSTLSHDPIGKKLISINGYTATVLDSLILQYECGETADWKRRKFRQNQHYPIYLNTLGVSNNGQELTIEYQRGKDQTFKITVPAKSDGGYHKISRAKRRNTFTYKQNNGFFYKVDSSANYGYLQMNTSLDLVSIKNEINNYTSFLTRPLAMIFLKKQTKDARDFGKVLADFMREVQANNINNIILDLRNNTGGDERLGKQFIWYLEKAHQNGVKGFTDHLKVSDYFRQQIKKDARKYDELYREKYGKPLPNGEINLTQLLGDTAYFKGIEDPESGYYLDSSIPKFSGNLFILTSSVTNSAGQVLATTIADNSFGKIIGIPPGNKPSTQTGASMFKLPNTKKIVPISYTFFERPLTSRNEEKELKVDHQIYNTFEDFLNGRDAPFEYILSEVGRQ